MNSYVITTPNGELSERHFDSDSEAERWAIDWIGNVLGYEDAVAADQWDADGTNDDDEPMERLLFWASEEDAENDAGANAIAQLSVVRA
jgi:hypothetical protein